MSQLAKLGGLGLGTTWTSLLFLVTIVLLAGYLSLRQRRDMAAAKILSDIAGRR